MKSRIKELRKTLDVTLAEFGASLGVATTTAHGWERTGKVPEKARRQICATYNVNREWLDTGSGDMFVEPPSRDQTDYETFMKLLCQIVNSLPEEQRRTVRSIAKQIVQHYE